MIRGEYKLTLLCDANVPGHYSSREFIDNSVAGDALFTGGSRDECVGLARRAGWVFDFARKRALCPKCATANRRPRAPGLRWSESHTKGKAHGFRHDPKTKQWRSLCGAHCMEVGDLNGHRLDGTPTCSECLNALEGPRTETPA